MVQSSRGRHEEVTEWMGCSEVCFAWWTVGTKWRLQMQPIAKWEETSSALA